MPQTATPAPAAGGNQSFSSDLGFTYSIPADYTVVDAQPMMPVLRMQEERTADSAAEKKGMDCAQPILVARHANGSVIVVMGLTSDCMGTPLTADQLAQMGIGVVQGMEQGPSGVVLKNPQYGAFRQSDHDFWIVKSNAPTKDAPDTPHWLEAVLTVVPRGVVFWLFTTPDGAQTAGFENTLLHFGSGGDAPLVPATAFTSSGH